MSVYGRHIVTCSFIAILAHVCNALPCYKWRSCQCHILYPIFQNSVSAILLTFHVLQNHVCIYFRHTTITCHAYCTQTLCMMVLYFCLVVKLSLLSNYGSQRHCIAARIYNILPWYLCRTGLWLIWLICCRDIV